MTEIYNEIRKMKDVELTMDELTLGKDSLVRSMPGRFETTAQTVDSFRTLFVYNLGLDYYSKYHRADRLARRGRRAHRCEPASRPRPDAGRGRRGSSED